MQPFAKAFYTSQAWRKCRASFIAYRISIDGGVCQTCHKELGYIVHHKTKLTPNNINDQSITLNHNELEYDCLICHNTIYNLPTAEGLSFDEDGNLI